MLGGSQLLKHVLKQIVAKRHASVRISSSRESQSPQSSRRWRSTDLLHPCEQMVIQCRNAKIMIRNGGIHQAPCELCEPKHRALDLSLFRLDDCGRQHQILSKTYTYIHIYIYIYIYIYPAACGKSRHRADLDFWRIALNLWSLKLKTVFHAMLRVVVATLMSVFLYDAFLYAFARVRYDMRRKCLDVITVGVATLLLL